jgi:trans-aconitate methyltransferase
MSSEVESAGTAPGGQVFEVPVFDTTKAHPARVYDYWLGGKDNYEADRQAALAVKEAVPTILVAVRENRAFLRRAVEYLVADCGIRQFLDIGTGLPTRDNTHEVAQRMAPDARIVYVDNDPIVLAHARALLTSTPEGVTTYIEADARDTATVLREAARTLDFSQPVAVMILCVMQYIPDSYDPHGIVTRLMAQMPPGSYLAMSDTTRDIDTEWVTEGADRLNTRLGSTQFTARSRAEFGAFFDGLDLVEPGLVPVQEWRPVHPGAHQSVICALGRTS